MPMFGFGRKQVERLEGVRDTVVWVLARTKGRLPPDDAKALGDVIRMVNEVIAAHVNLAFWKS